LEEWAIIEKLKQGDAHAFKELVETWQRMVYNTVLGIVQNEQDAEDIAQEVFVQVYQSIHSFKGESKFSTWLYRIACSKSLDHLRRLKRKKRFAFVQRLFGDENEITIQVPDFQHPGVLLDQKEHAVQLFKAIQRLPENQRIAFTLNKLEGLSYQEISEVLDTTVSAVESLLHRAKANLRNWLQDIYRE
jgi:RNA polymerase sigma factor (sigma-70 family)